jgi:hypothetical protein
LLEFGALVIDIDGDTLTSQFLNEFGVVTDHFQIVKGNACPPTPASGCNASAKGTLSIKDSVDNTKDKFGWKWQNGSLLSAALGDPSNQTDLATCIYDQAGKLVGGQVPHGTLFWTVTPTQLKYKDNLAASAGIQKMTIKPNVLATKAKFLVKGKGAAVNAATLPGTFPVTAQLINLDSNVCWQTTFPTAKKNVAGTLKAKIP